MKNAIITGAYGVIGKEISIGLLRQGYNVLLVGRDNQQLLGLRQAILGTSPDEMVQSYCLDVSSKKEIDQFANACHHHIDVLVNNAAAAPRKRMENEDGIEMQWATNVLGYYWMIRSFTSHLLDADDPRVVNVASYWAGGLDLDDPEFKSKPYNNDLAYRQSKQADRMLTYGLANVYGNKISINACHPGDANSKLSNDLGFGGSESAKHAAATPLLLATQALGHGGSGLYYEHGKISFCRFKTMTSEIDRLQELCEKY